jgi:hypothetical protein
MPRLSASLLILLAAAFTFAQTSSNPPALKKSSIPVHPAAGSGCPVGFSASRQAPVQIMSVGNARQSSPAQGLHLTLDNRDAPAIESVEVKVYGAAQKTPYLPVGTLFTDIVSKTFELHRTSGSASLSEADVSMHLIGSLSWADLISITYADGSTWHPTENLNKCRAIPSNLLLIGSR